MKEKHAGAPMVSDRWSYLWLVIGTLLAFAWHMPLVWWLTPLFLIRFMRSQKVWRGFVLIWLSSWLTVGVSMYDILNTMMPSPLPVYLVTAAVTALLMGGLPYLADRLLAPRLPGFAATLVFPLIMTTLDVTTQAGCPQHVGLNRFPGTRCGQ